MTVKRTNIEVFIEIPRGSRNKYEYDKERQIFKLDRVLYSSVHYPTDYGFIPDSLSLDGDPLDALVIVDNPTFSGCVVDGRPIGVLDMTDEQGHDEKILMVPTHDPRYRHINKLEDIGPHWLREIENFFATYKALEDKWTELVGWEDETRAWEIIEEAEQRYRDLKELKNRNKTAPSIP
ncbi:MAG: inorganic diphosphatase [Chloroflexi bacterium]|nr:inorganic diphosphatase [Chloroflexota bacterium]